MKPKIRIDFCDFSANFPKTDNVYYHLLSERFDVQICDQPDFLFYGCYGHEHRLHSGVRIFVCWEPQHPDFNVCDYSIGCIGMDDPRHLQVPLYVTYGGLTAESIVKKNDDFAQIMAAKKKFCCFVVSSANPQDRVKFFHRLSQYKQVDSGGRYLNNIGGPISGNSGGKVNFLRQYKFNIAFENNVIPGYTTEKIFEPMAARCLPIYRGDPQITQQFNPKSFLNLSDFPSEEGLIEKIIELDRDDAKYLEYLRQPYFHNDEPNIYFSRSRMLDFFEKIFTSPLPPQKSKKSFIFGRWILVKKHHIRSRG